MVEQAHRYMVEQAHRYMVEQAHRYMVEQAHRYMVEQVRHVTTRLYTSHVRHLGDARRSAAGQMTREPRQVHHATRRPHVHVGVRIGRTYWVQVCLYACMLACTRI